MDVYLDVIQVVLDEVINNVDRILVEKYKILIKQIQGVFHDIVVLNGLIPWIN